MWHESTHQAKRLREELEKRGLRVLSEVNDHGYKHVDLAVPSARINIEVDGKQHYESTHQILSDLKRTHFSDNEGYDTIHIPNGFIDNEEDLQKVSDALAEAARIRKVQLRIKLHHKYR